jgi:hypothetical protein
VAGCISSYEERKDRVMHEMEWCEIIEEASLVPFKC